MRGMNQAADEIERLKAENKRMQVELAAERERVQEYSEWLRQKDQAMGVLFERLTKAGVDCSDLIS